MHSAIYLITQDKTYDSIPTEDDLTLPEGADYCSKDSPKEQKDSITWLSQQYPDLKIKHRSFELSEAQIKTWQDAIYAERKNIIQHLLNKDPLTSYTLYEIATTAKPRIGMMFKFEHDTPQPVEDFILDNPTNGKYYIVQTYDYHF